MPNLFFSLVLLSQTVGSVNVGTGNTLPSKCAVGQVYITTTNPSLNICSSINTWTSLSTAPVPSGSILLVNSGSCPTGFTEQSGMNGKTLFGTLNANGDVGGTGGTDSITPTGTNGSLTFTGTPFTAIINHTHAVTSVGSAATGSTTNLTGTSDTSSTTATAANPAGGISSITPAGTINTPSFTGNSFDNRSAFMKVIFCKKD
jgi:hypothetical protein